MTFDPETATFLIAGPVRIHPRVLRAMNFSSVNHRGDYFHQRVGEIREMLPMLFGAPGHHAILSGSGTAGLEATYSALLRPEDRVVVLSNGNFGERGDEIARRYSNHVTTVSAPWGHPVPLDTLAAAYAEVGDFDKAVESQEKASKLYTDADDRKKGEDRLKLYQQRKPYREEDK